MPTVMKDQEDYILHRTVMKVIDYNLRLIVTKVKMIWRWGSYVRMRSIPTTMIIIHQINYQLHPPRYAAEYGAYGYTPSYTGESAYAYAQAPQMFSDDNPNACSVM